MKIPLTLNEKKVVLDAEPSEKLLNVLRRNKMNSVKCGCEKGVCGSCMVLLNDVPVASCLIPIGTIRDASVITLEYFKSTVEYQEITQGFAQAGVHLCGYCNSGKYFTAYNILRHNIRPDRDTLYHAIRGLDLCCTDLDTYANGIYYSIAIKHAKEGKHNNGKK